MATSFSKFLEFSGFFFHCSVQIQLDCVDEDTKSKLLELPYMSQGILVPYPHPTYLARLLSLIFLAWLTSLAVRTKGSGTMSWIVPFLDSPFVSVRDAYLYSPATL